MDIHFHSGFPTSGDLTILRQSVLFRGLTIERIRRLTSESEIGLVTTGHVFYQPGERLDALRLVLSGGVLLEKSRVGRGPVCFDVCEAGRTFGDFAALLDRPTENSARAASLVRFMALPIEPFRRLLVEDDEMASSIIAAAAAHARATADHLIRLSTLTSRYRVADLLLRLSENRGNSVDFALPYEKSMLAHMIAMRPESFSRALSQLATVGVTQKRDVVRLSSIDRLRSFVACRLGSLP